MRFFPARNRSTPPGFDVHLIVHRTQIPIQNRDVIPQLKTAGAYAEGKRAIKNPLLPRFTGDNTVKEAASTRGDAMDRFIVRRRVDIWRRDLAGRQNGGRGQ